MGLWGKLKKTVTTNVDEKEVKEPVEKTQDSASSVNDTPKTVTTKKKSSKPVELKETGDAYKILLQPLVTEKTVRLEAENKYVFKVALNANKITIKHAIERVYGVRAQSVTVTRYDGKAVRFKWRKGRRSDWKKAVVTLKKGDRIDINS